jgi:hypothetical protein
MFCEGERFHKWMPEALTRAQLAVERHSNNVGLVCCVCRFLDGASFRRLVTGKWMEALHLALMDALFYVVQATKTGIGAATSSPADFAEFIVQFCAKHFSKLDDAHVRHVERHVERQVEIGWNRWCYQGDDDDTDLLHILREVLDKHAEKSGIAEVSGIAEATFSGQEVRCRHLFGLVAFLLVQEDRRAGWLQVAAAAVPAAVQCASPDAVAKFKMLWEELSISNGDGAAVAGAQWKLSVTDCLRV